MCVFEVFGVGTVMNSVMDVAGMLADLQQLVYVLGEDAGYSEAASGAQCLRVMFERSLDELTPNNNSNAQQSDYEMPSLRSLHAENRLLRQQLEQVDSATEHVLASHRATLLRLIASKDRPSTPQQTSKEDTTPQCGSGSDVGEERIAEIAAVAAQVVEEAVEQAQQNQKTADRIAFENTAIRYLISSLPEAGVSVDDVLAARRNIGATVSTGWGSGSEDVFTVELLLESLRNAEAEFWKEHETDRRAMEEQARRSAAAPSQRLGASEEDADGPQTPRQLLRPSIYAEMKYRAQHEANSLEEK